MIESDHTKGAAKILLYCGQKSKRWRRAYRHQNCTLRLEHVIWRRKKIMIDKIFKTRIPLHVLENLECHNNCIVGINLSKNCQLFIVFSKIREAEESKEAVNVVRILFAHNEMDGTTNGYLSSALCNLFCFRTFLWFTRCPGLYKTVVSFPFGNTYPGQNLALSKLVERRSNVLVSIQKLLWRTRICLVGVFKYNNFILIDAVQPWSFENLTAHEFTFCFPHIK